MLSLIHAGYKFFEIRRLGQLLHCMFLQQMLNNPSKLTTQNK